jgi:hypothetical protein
VVLGLIDWYLMPIWQYFSYIEQKTKTCYQQIKSKILLKVDGEWFYRILGCPPPIKLTVKIFFG